MGVNALLVVLEVQRRLARGARGAGELEEVACCARKGDLSVACAMCSLEVLEVESHLMSSEWQGARCARLMCSKW
eukprot:5859904-Amphidinium_carterae.1